VRWLNQVLLVQINALMHEKKPTIIFSDYVQDIDASETLISGFLGLEHREWKQAFTFKSEVYSLFVVTFHALLFTAYNLLFLILEMTCLRSGLRQSHWASYPVPLMPGQALHSQITSSKSYYGRSNTLTPVNVSTRAFIPYCHATRIWFPPRPAPTGYRHGRVECN